MQSRNEKQEIEYYTVTFLLPHLNKALGSDYAIHEHADSPDFILKNSDGGIIGVEATIIDDREGDIAHQLGRREQRRTSQSADFSGGEPLRRLIDRIKEKLTKQYGMSCALAVRQTSPIEWDWAVHREVIAREVQGLPQPYDQGVWIISLSGNVAERVL